MEFNFRTRNTFEKTIGFGRHSLFLLISVLKLTAQLLRKKKRESDIFQVVFNKENLNLLMSTNKYGIMKGSNLRIFFFVLVQLNFVKYLSVDPCWWILILIIQVFFF